MKAIILLRDAGNNKHWGTVRLVGSNKFTSPSASFCYDTEIFNNSDDALVECRKFCNWKKLKIQEVKYT